VKEFCFIHYGLFVTYFPHLIADPVLHHKEMMPQFADAENYRLKAENFAVGSAIFMLGLAKKVLIADNFSPMVGSVFSGHDPQFTQAWIGLLAQNLFNISVTAKPRKRD
jgi:alginate O-acetyltransferase complex protein AlgI